MIQGVREVFEMVPLDDGAGEVKRQMPQDRMGKLVLIGRGIDGEELGRSLRAALEQ